MNAMDWRVNLLTDKFRFMNAGTANVIPVKLFPLDPFFNVFNRWQLPLQFFRQAAGYFIRTEAFNSTNEKAIQTSRVVHNDNHSCPAAPSCRTASSSAL